jgi:hypothetical protein
MSDLRIFSGSDYIYLDWPVTTDGWSTDFSIQIEDTNSTLENDFDNSTTSGDIQSGKYHSSIAPPYNVSNLLPEHQYQIVITTSLNDKWKTTLVMNDVFTTANNSKLPEEIIGVSFKGIFTK